MKVESLQQQVDTLMHKLAIAQASNQKLEQQQLGTQQALQTATMAAATAESRLQQLQQQQELQAQQHATQLAALQQALEAADEARASAVEDKAAAVAEAAMLREKEKQVCAEEVEYARQLQELKGCVQQEVAAIGQGYFRQSFLDMLVCSAGGPSQQCNSTNRDSGGSQSQHAMNKTLTHSGSGSTTHGCRDGNGGILGDSGVGLDAAVRGGGAEGDMQDLGVREELWAHQYYWRFQMVCSLGWQQLQEQLQAIRSKLAAAAAGVEMEREAAEPCYDAINESRMKDEIGPEAGSFSTSYARSSDSSKQAGEGGAAEAPTVIAGAAAAEEEGFGAPKGVAAAGALVGSGPSQCSLSPWGYDLLLLELGVVQALASWWQVEQQREQQARYAGYL
jgi:hypothetical protein